MVRGLATSIGMSALRSLLLIVAGEADGDLAEG